MDANVLFSKTLLDWLFLLKLHNRGMFQVHTTEDVCAEVLANMRDLRPQAPGHYTARRLELIRENLDEVIPDFPAGLPFTGADPHDYHVHAAAIAAQADLILTCNAATDITRVPDQETYEVMHPDHFFCLVAESSPSGLREVVPRQLEYWSARPDHLQLDDALRKADCPEFACLVRQELRRMARS